MSFQTNGSERLRINSAGNVGIGTSSPDARLVVLDSANDLQMRVGSLTAGIDPIVRLQGKNVANTTNRFADIKLDADNGVLTLMAPSNVGPTIDALNIDSAGDVGIGTISPTYKLHLDNITAGDGVAIQDSNDVGSVGLYFLNGSNVIVGSIFGLTDNTGMSFQANGSERCRISSAGDLLVGKTATSLTATGSQLNADGTIYSVVTTGEAAGVYVNRQADDGVLISLRQANTQEGNISVSGTTVSYNGGHLSRWAQTTTAKDESLVKGTVLSNLDEMNTYTDAEGNPVANEQLNKVKVSDVEGDSNVAGVFVNWTHDEQHNVDEINMAMTGDMIIRIAQGVTVVRGDLLMSAGDGTAKPQGDDIVRSKTVAKVTSNHVTCTYADGSYCVPCVLMAC